MSTIETLLARARSMGIEVFEQGGKVKVKGSQPKGSEVNALLAELREHREEIKAVLADETDPILKVEQWFPEFHRFHAEVCEQTPELDWGWVKKNKSDLYQEIKALENRIDDLGKARLSQVIEIVREWRILVLRAYWMQRDEEKQPNS